MIIILNLTRDPLTQEDQEEIERQVIKACDKQYLNRMPQFKVLNIPPRSTAQDTFDAIPVTWEQWLDWPIVPRLRAGEFGGALLELVNDARGYDWPTRLVR